MKRANLKGEKFGKLTVIDFYSIDKWGAIQMAMRM